jgi:uroporphyrinogen III methyltransferase/synthase
VILSPAIRFEEPADWGAFDRAVDRAGRWDWVILTSANGVEAADRRLRLRGRAWSDFERARFGAIGPATAEALVRLGVEVTLVPEEFRAEGLLAALPVGQIQGRRVLVARAGSAREVLPEELSRRGAEVEVAVVYRTVPCAPTPEALSALRGRGEGGRLVVIFTSPSTVSGFVDGLPEDALAALRGTTLAAIGPVTGEALDRRGLRAEIQPAAYTVDGLVGEIRAHFGRPGI